MLLSMIIGGLASVMATRVIEEKKKIERRMHYLEAVYAILNLYDHPVIRPISFCALPILK